MDLKDGWELLVSWGRWPDNTSLGKPRVMENATKEVLCVGMCVCVESKFFCVGMCVYVESKVLCVWACVSM